MDMTFEEVLEFAKKHPPPKGGIDFKPEFKWLGVGYNIEAFIWNKRHPDDPVPYIPELDEEGLKELEKEVNSL
ncbi:MAG: hypothetical protein J6Q11_01155 [Fibrobacteraceae bacterium]|nr:hypothetical protein [Fibrobacteraceae bacterium]